MKWLYTLPHNSLHSWDDLGRMFHAEWGEKRYLQYYLTNLFVVKKNSSENVEDFTKQFNKLYNEIVNEIKPSPIGFIVSDTTTFEHDFSIMLRERRQRNLVDMQ